MLIRSKVFLILNAVVLRLHRIHLPSKLVKRSTTALLLQETNTVAGKMDSIHSFLQTNLFFLKIPRSRPLEFLRLSHRLKLGDLQSKFPIPDFMGALPMFSMALDINQNSAVCSFDTPMPNNNRLPKSF